jgi:hypothetical protein
MNAKVIVGSFLAAEMVVGLASTTLAANPKKPPKLPNGGPFQFLQAEIDDVRADLDALSGSLGAALDEIRADIVALQGDIASLEGDIDNLQDQIDTNAGDIDALEDDIDAIELEIAILNAELAAKQDILDPAGGCPGGSSLRVIFPDGSFICEQDDSGGGVNILVVFSAQMSVSSGSGGPVSATASCPGGFRASGGGFETGPSNPKGPLFQSSGPSASGNGWTVEAVFYLHPNSPQPAILFFRATAVCIG